VKLVYQIPNKLYYIQKFLDSKTYKNIHNSIFKERKNINLETTKGTWSQKLIENIIAPKKLDVENYLPFEKLKTLVHRNQFYQLKDVKTIYSTIHYMEKGSGINWHDDNGWRYGATYYINNKWNYQFGGELMFTSENGHGYIPIVGNSLIIIKAPLEHKVNPVLSPIIPRVSIQMFIK
jgi:Rps23 Pro-64 3,4-dihydroxylase Tpa1-like proline 4-hydroxylase